MMRITTALAATLVAVLPAAADQAAAPIRSMDTTQSTQSLDAIPELGLSAQGATVAVSVVGALLVVGLVAAAGGGDDDDGDGGSVNGTN